MYRYMYVCMYAYFFKPMNHGSYPLHIFQNIKISCKCIHVYIAIEMYIWIYIYIYMHM